MVYFEARSIILGNLFNLCHSVSGKGQLHVLGAQQSRGWKEAYYMHVHVSVHNLVATCLVVIYCPTDSVCRLVVGSSMRWNTVHVATDCSACINLYGMFLIV